jgi:hypothetical protein
MNNSGLWWKMPVDTSLRVPACLMPSSLVSLYLTCFSMARILPALGPNLGQRFLSVVHTYEHTCVVPACQDRIQPIHIR